MSQSQHPHPAARLALEAGRAICCFAANGLFFHCTVLNNFKQSNSLAKDFTFGHVIISQEEGTGEEDTK
jgi:hypothetical protein